MYNTSMKEVNVTLRRGVVVNTCALYSRDCLLFVYLTTMLLAHVIQYRMTAEVDLVKKEFEKKWEEQVVVLISSTVA